MANTYDTSMYPLGSTKPKVVYANAENFDEWMNSGEPWIEDRFGDRRLTIKGAEYEMYSAIANMGWETTHLTYTDGSPLVVARPTQLFDRAGLSYKIKQPAAFPVTLTGTWATDQNNVVQVADDTLRAALAGPGGAGMVFDGTKSVSTKLGDIRRKTIQEFYIAGQTNWDLAMAAARSDMNASPTPMRLVFPAGVYEYSESPNWAKQDCEIVAEGEVRLRYTGTGRAVILDAGPNPADLVYNMTMGPFIVEAPGGAQDGVFIRSVHHSRLAFTVRGAGSSYAGIRINFSVCNEYRLVCSVNQEGWYLGAKPAVGLVMDQRNAFEQTAYCTFINPIIEGLHTGISMPNALGNTFLGGTSEACDEAVVINAASYCNKFYGLDMEANVTVDVYCEGYGNEFVNVDTDKYVLFANSAHNNTLNGGSHKTVQVQATCYGNLVTGAKINRSNTGGTLELAGDNRSVNCYDVGTGKWLSDVDGPHAEIVFSINLNDGQSTQAVVACQGAQLGMFAEAAMLVSTAGLETTTWVSATNEITVQFNNRTGSAKVISGVLLKVRARP